MNIKQIINLSTEKIENVSTSPRLDSELITAEVIGKSRAYLLANGNEALTQEVVLEVKKLIARRSKGEPVAYILERKEFYGLDFYVDKNVLIPRPETEELVDLVIDHIKQISSRENRANDKEAVSLLDVGTGSGCIGVTIAHLFCEGKFNNIKLDITLSDVSQVVLKVAMKNYWKLVDAKCKIKTGFVKSDLLTSIDDKFDIIVANLPYIPKEKIKSLNKGVKDFEPRKALDGGEEGLEFVKKLLLQIEGKLNNEGKVFLEIFHDQRKELEKFVEEEELPLKAYFQKDLAGKERYAILQLFNDPIVNAG